MSSDKKADEILKRIVVKPSFQKGVLEIRRKYRIPDSGFLTEKEAFDRDQDMVEEYFFDSIKGKIKNPKFRDYENDIHILMKDSGIAFNLFPLVNQYVSSNNFDYGNELPYMACKLSFSSPKNPFKYATENNFERHGEKYVKIFIHKDSELPDVKKYLDKHWWRIKHFLQMKGKGDGIRLRGNWERDQLIYQLYGCTKQELEDKLRSCEEIHGVKYSKEALIGKLLFHCGYDSISSKAVEKVIERQKKLRLSDK